MPLMAAMFLKMKHLLLIVTSLLLACPVLWAQEVAPQQPGTLFAYPLASDTCSTLESRCNYIITHFWDNFDISKPITDNELLRIRSATLWTFSATVIAPL